jgi:hypothetical protein
MYLLVFIFLVLGCYSQVRKKPPVKPATTVKPVKKGPPAKTDLSFGVGVARSVLFLMRNTKHQNDATGFTSSVVYGGSKLVRGGFEYTVYRTINIEPTWYNVRAQTFEVNAHFLARLKDSKAFFYPLFGLSYNVFKGYFTGRNDFQNLAERYSVNRTVRTQWLGLNVGTGYEQHFKPLIIFVDYKMRIGFSDVKNQLNIIDVCFGAGIRFNLRAPSVYSIFKGTRSRYLLDIDE